MTGSHISLFSGVGMTDLAAESLGFKTIATAEIDPFNRSVLEARFPDAVHFDDVRKIKGNGRWRPQRVGPLLISGGFPCQDVSGAGTAKGLDGERSGLWSEFKRVIGEFEPEYVLIENVAMLRSRGLDRVLNDLHHLGYDAQWDCIPAAYVGAPHLRDRVWIGAVRRRDVRPGGARKVTGTKIIGSVRRPGEGLHTTSQPTLTKLPRAGAMVGGLIFDRKPQATIKAARSRARAHGRPRTPRSRRTASSLRRGSHAAKRSRLRGSTGTALGCRWRWL
jgi:DNA-cytosine methyltransferase